MASFVLISAALFCAVAISSTSSATTNLWRISTKSTTESPLYRKTPNTKRSTSTTERMRWYGQTTTSYFDAYIQKILNSQRSSTSPEPPTPTAWPWLTKRTTTMWWQRKRKTTTRQTTTTSNPLWWFGSTTSPWDDWGDDLSTRRPTTTVRNAWEISSPDDTGDDDSVDSTGIIVGITFPVIFVFLGACVLVMGRRTRRIPVIIRRTNILVIDVDSESTVNPADSFLPAEVPPNIDIGPPAYDSVCDTTPPPSYEQVAPSAPPVFHEDNANARQVLHV